ncbi:spore maturation protein [Tepidimicrobium xylanilyticum]|uniref:Spore maturation protein B n=1 Tax=Tepidimicrobium xylanilyticum TaxID=1123352 RepID=A0A1H2WK89_9FIRM|nr:nucleoside recognition domain-containing protein [Tepidimicrobium xylanilyticum]GMG95218.1 spore maturation protein B [Tepidimicrobium xylanilyticum]SDW80928.1 spore maturation protein B [Tepidimicrobium xylanilyticum]
MLDIISLGIVPFLVIVIVVHGYLKKVDIYDAFTEGAFEGLKTAFKIIPNLIAIFIAIGIFRSSEALDMFIDLVRPITHLLRIPEEILPLIFIRPLSGSGALGLVRDIISHYGPDSLLGITASILMGSSETIFYTMALYFGSIGVKDHGHTLRAALLSYVVSIFIIMLLIRYLVCLDC